MEKPIELMHTIHGFTIKIEDPTVKYILKEKGYVQSGQGVYLETYEVKK